MLTIEFSPTEEAQIAALARQTGLAPAEYAKKLVQENLPSAQIETEAEASQRRAAAIAQLQAWKEEDFTDDPEEIRQAEADFKELLHNLNQNRIESGERPLFPDAPYTS